MIGELSTADDRILEAAGRLFAERGYKGSTTRAIAALAGVNEVTVFRRFGSKAGVLRAFGGMLARDNAGGASAAMDLPDRPREAFEVLALAEAESALRFGGAAMRLALEASSTPEVSEVVGGGMRNNLKGLSAYIAKCQAAGSLRNDIDPDVLAGAFFSLTSSFVMFQMIARPEGLPDAEIVRGTVKGLVDVFLRGAAPAAGW
jgi:AcrR family transcriptional regulator